jgi:hypothetical protein
MVRRILPLLLIGLAACSGDQAGRPASPGVARGGDSIVQTVDSLRLAGEPAAPEADSAPEPVPELPPAAGYLVWSADSARAETVWLDGEGRVVARRSGVYVAHGGVLWRWRDGSERFEGVDCDCVRRTPEADCYVTRPVGTAALDEVAGPARIPLLQVPRDEYSSERAPPIQSAIPVAGAGPYLFTEAGIETDGCGAHGFYHTERALFDLRTRVQMQTDTARYTPADSAAALAELIATNPIEKPVAGFALNNVEARWRADGALDVAFRFYTDAPYAFSDEGGSYSRTVRIPARRPPPWLRPWTRAPGPVRRYWQSAPPGERAGWSAPDSAHAAALLARFRG